MSDTAPETPVVEPEPPQPLVVLMGRVLAAVPAVGKNSQAPSNMGGYAFRGIEDVLAALKPAMARHGVFCIPDVIERLPTERQLSGGKIMFVVDLCIRWTFHGPAGDTLTSTCWGQGTDMGDKATQKAMTSAFKSMLMQTFCIGDAASDAEAHDVPDTHAGKDPGAWFSENGWADAAEYDAARKLTNEALAAASEPVKVAFRSWWADQGHEWKDAWSKPLATAVVARLEALTAERPEGDGPTNPVQTPETPAPASESGAGADSEPLPDPDPGTSALIAFVESLHARLVGEALEARNAALPGASKVRQARLAKILAAEGWEPSRGHMPPSTDPTPESGASVPPGLPEPVCAWCGKRESTTGELPAINGNGGWMHEPCRVEWQEDKDEMEKPF